jgi:threonine synthase
MNSFYPSWPSPLLSLAPQGLDTVVVEGKLEVYGPTGSHKDRECALMIPAAIAREYLSVGCSSTGNLARALASACRAAGLGCELWLSSEAKPDLVESLKEMHARVHLVDGGYAEAVRVGNATMAERHIFNGNPSRCAEKLQASEALGKEILDETNATHLVCATNNGSLAFGLLRATQQGSREVKLVAVTCSNTTIAHSIAGTHELEEKWRLEQNSQLCQRVEVSDPEIKHWATWLGLQGLSLQPAAAATLAALPKLALTAGDRVVCLLSGLRAGAAAPAFPQIKGIVTGDEGSEPATRLGRG